MTYDWGFSSLDCYKSHKGQTDVVFDIVWSLTARDGDFSWTHGGHLKVTYESGQPFIPFPDLTESDVQGWCEAGLDVDAIKTALDAKVAKLQNPTTEVMDLPWASNGP